MPLEFALRPRIRLREDLPQRAANRRTRWRVPRFALPAALYWAVMGGVCYGIIRLHDAPSSEALAEARELPSEPELSSDPAPVSDAPVTEAGPAPEATVEQNPEPPPSPSVSAAPSLEDEQPAPRLHHRELGEEMSQALLTQREPAAAAAPRQRGLGHADQPLLSANLPETSQPEPSLPPPPAPSPPARGFGSSLPSCEAAAAAAVQDFDFASSDRTADLPSEAISGVLDNGAWLGGCSLPSSTHLDVCVAIKGGRVTAVTVTSHPADAALNACVKQRAAALQFPYSTRVDVARTRF